MTEPSVLVFDVNETLLDIGSLAPFFHRLFGDPKVLREWFAQLILYSEAITLSGLYEDFFSLGRAVLEMLGAIHGVSVKPADVDELKALLLTMPPHPDVEEGLATLQRAGFRMVTCTNSPPNPHGKSPVEHAGLAHYFERQLSVHTLCAFKPAQQVYHTVAQELGVSPASCCMIAAHVWDTLGAQSAGFSAALVTRSNNAPLPLKAIPQPQIIAPDIPGVAAQLLKQWR